MKRISWLMKSANTWLVSTKSTGVIVPIIWKVSEKSIKQSVCGNDLVIFHLSTLPLFTCHHPVQISGAKTHIRGFCTKKEKRKKETICRRWLSVAPRVVGGEVQRKGKEVKRRGGENHVWSPPCTALSFLGRLVFVSLYPSHVASVSRESSSSSRFWVFVFLSQTLAYWRDAAGGFVLCHTDCRPWWARQMTSRRRCLTVIRLILRMKPGMEPRTAEKPARQVWRSPAAVVRTLHQHWPLCYNTWHAL